MTCYDGAGVVRSRREQVWPPIHQRSFYVRGLFRGATVCLSILAMVF